MAASTVPTSGIVQEQCLPNIVNNVAQPSINMLDPEKVKLIQHQLLVLLHSTKCLKQENHPNDTECTVPHCRAMKNVINHLGTCRVGRSCPFPRCFSSRQILIHWIACTRNDCPICVPLKRTTERQQQPGMEPEDCQEINLNFPLEQSAPQMAASTVPTSGIVQEQCLPNIVNNVAQPSINMLDPEKVKLIQHQLLVLLHSTKCLKQENHPNDTECTVPHCRAMKNVINHLGTCRVGRSCPFPRCFSSRQILIHWIACTRNDCPICVPLKRTTERQQQPGMEPEDAPALK